MNRGEASTQLVKYVFLDVVRFTHQRSVEAQVEIVSVLNDVVSSALDDLSIEQSERILLPTGDGLCIALPGGSTPFDLHLRLALTILRRVREHDDSTEDAMRKFEIRVGLSENVDNLVTDINGNRNVAGAGVSTAQRVMGLADGGQLLVHATVHETLRYREQYLDSFRKYEARVKHGLSLSVFQFVDERHPEVQAQVPSAFQPPQPTEKGALSELEAYYLAHAIRNESWLVMDKGVGQADYAAAVLLYFLARDSVSKAHSKSYEEPTTMVRGEGSLSPQEAYSYYKGMDFWVCARLADCVARKLQSIRHFLERWPHVVSSGGRDALRADHPQIWRELDLDNADVADYGSTDGAHA